MVLHVTGYTKLGLLFSDENKYWICKEINRIAPRKIIFGGSDCDYTG
jgi:hypothetical protein